MANCEMCGSEGPVLLSLIEGVELNVCKNCSAFGKIIRRRKAVSKKETISKPQKEREIIQVITEDYSFLIRNKREKLGLKQKEFAKFLAEKESLIHKMESGSYIPSLDLARKIERQLGITLVEQKEVQPQSLKTKSSAFTIGDVIKVK
ncbi:TIGR00270 family protein [Candidatus Woesearchaeota archaeon]|nr:TIGR00270 family protein [Candidatus Woesearchaeota archaeon]